MKKLLVILVGILSVAQAGEVVSAQLRYSGDGALPTLKFNMPSQDDPSAFVGFEAAFDTYVFGVNYDGYSGFYTSSPSSKKISLVKSFSFYTCNPYIGLSVGDNKKSGLDAGISFDIF